MWSGAESQFGRILSIMAAQIGDMVPAHVEASTASTRRRLETAQSALAENVAEFERAEAGRDARGASMWSAGVDQARRQVQRLEQDLEDERTTAERAALISMTVTSGGSVRETAGTPEELVAYLRGRDIDALSLTAPARRISGYSISVSAGVEKGVDLRVSSADDRWATAAFSYLKDEIGRNVPWWSFARNFGVIYAAIFLAVSLALWNVFDIIARLTTETGKFDLNTATWAWVGVFGGALILALTLSNKALEWLKAFEVIPDGIPRRRGPLRLIGYIAGTMVLSVAANWVSALLMGSNA